MSIESLLETQPFLYTVSGQLATAVVGNAQISVASTVGFAHDSIIAYVDNAGLLQFHTINTIDNPLQFTCYQAARAAAAGGVGNIIYNITMQSDFVQVRTDRTEQVIRMGGGIGGGQNGNLLSVSGLSKISANEGILVKSVYMRLPYQFTLGSNGASMQLFNRLAAVGGPGVVVTTLGENGLIKLPIENTEIPVNAYIPPLGINWQLISVINGLVKPETGALPSPAVSGALAHVSMINVPASLNYQYLPVIVGMRIVHAATTLAA